MNKKRRGRIYTIIYNLERINLKTEGEKEKLKQLLEYLEDILWEEEDSFNNMPENLQVSYNGCLSEEAIEYIGDAIDAINNSIVEKDIDRSSEYIQEAIENLENI